MKNQYNHLILSTVEILKANFKEALKRVADQYIELDLTGAPLQQIKVLESNKIGIEWVKFIPNCHIFDNEGTLFIDLYPAGFYMEPASVFIVMKRVFTDKKNRRERINNTSLVLESPNAGGTQERVAFLAKVIFHGDLNNLRRRGLIYKNDAYLVETYDNVITGLLRNMKKWY